MKAPVMFVTLPLSLALNLVFWLTSPPGWLIVGAVTLLLGASLSQGFHGSLHRSDVGWGVRAMRRVGLLMSEIRAQKAPRDADAGFCRHQRMVQSAGQFLHDDAAAAAHAAQRGPGADLIVIPRDSGNDRGGALPPQRQHPLPRGVDVEREPLENQLSHHRVRPLHADGPGVRLHDDEPNPPEIGMRQQIDLAALRCRRSAHRRASRRSRPLGNTSGSGSRATRLHSSRRGATPRMTATPGMRDAGLRHSANAQPARRSGRRSPSRCERNWRPRRRPSRGWRRRSATFSGPTIAAAVMATRPIAVPASMHAVARRNQLAGQVALAPLVAAASTSDWRISGA